MGEGLVATELKPLVLGRREDRAVGTAQIGGTSGQKAEGRKMPVMELASSQPTVTSGI